MTEGDRQLAHPTRTEIELETVLHALADPIRLRIVRELADSADDIACSAFDLPITKSTTTHHFRVLREAGVIHQQYKGTSKVSRLRRDDLADLFPGLLDSILAAAPR